MDRSMSKGPSCAMDAQLGVADILKQALCLPFKNKKLMLPVLLVSILPSSLLSMGHYVSMYPLLVSFIIKLYLLKKEDPSTPQFFDTVIGIKADAEDFLHVYKFFVVISYVLNLLSTLLVVLASAMAYSAKESAVDDLLARIKGAWKGLLVTRIYFTLLCIGYTVLSVSLIAVLMLNAEGSRAWIAMTTVLGISARLLYVYLAMVWTVGLVISVLEDGSCGLEALSRAGEIVKARRRQGFAIAIILLLVDGVLTGGYGFGVNKAHHPRMGLIVINVVLLLKMFSLMVYTVFYYECKKSHGSKVEMAGDLHKYTRVKTSPSVDEALP
ncbi:hypothetical protein Cni_G05017 [Canna indica]|uniref:Transmembrane protein n=1 Tax=Canna indica TaxID=4628 RepID=A0AAQ3Q4I7_9LILI|nr:hypothetical protein Cni_G05017 [Canna indica]